MLRKIFVISVLLLLSVQYQAEAFIVDVTYTGARRERIDLGGYGNGPVSPSYVSNLGTAGGPVANNSVGYAQQFILDKLTHINYLLVTAHIYSGLVHDGEVASNTFYFKLYSNTLTTYRGEPSSPFPDSSDISIVVPMFAHTSTYEKYIPELGITHTFNKDGFYKDYSLPFDITLDPGTYWIAQERYPTDSGGLEFPRPYLGRQDVVDSISVKFSAVPEPSTIFMFCLGVIAMGFGTGYKRIFSY